MQAKVNLEQHWNVLDPSALFRTSIGFVRGDPKPSYHIGIITSLYADKPFCLVPRASHEISGIMVEWS